MSRLSFPPRAVAVTQTLAVVAGSALVGVLAKKALAEVPALSFAWVQIVIGGALLSLYTFGWRRAPWPRGLSAKTWLTVGAIGVGNFALVRVLFVASLSHLPVTTHAYLINFVGIVTMALSAWLLRERPSRWAILGALLALAGLRFFFKELPAPSEITGIIYVGVGILVLAFTNIATRRLLLQVQIPSTVLSSISLWVGAVPAVILGLAVQGPPLGWSPRAWLTVFFSGVVSIAVGLTVWNHVLRTLRAYEASVLAASGVIFSALFAIPLLKEQLSGWQVFGMATVISGLVLVNVRRAG